METDTNSVKCQNCNFIGSLEQFTNSYKTKKICLLCWKQILSERSKKYYLKNKEKLIEYQRIYKCNNYDKLYDNRCKYYLKNKKEIRKKQKIYVENNKENIKQYKQNYYLDNLDKIKQNKRKYYLENKDFIKKYQNNNKEHIKKCKLKRKRNKFKNDLIFKIRETVSNHIRQGLNRSGFYKKNKSCWIELQKNWNLNSDQNPKEYLKQYLESLFEPWMNWDNWGIYDKNTWDDQDITTWKWQIDHIIPHSNFHYSSMEDEDFKTCWALKNLRPYSAKQNIIDGNRR